MPQHSRLLLAGLVGFLVGFAALASPLMANGSMNYVATFQQAAIRLDICTYFDPQKNPSKSGLLGIMTTSKIKNSFAFAIQEWPGLIKLTAKAARAQTDGNNWAVIGKLIETGTDDTSQLVVSAGTGIRFALNSAAGASLTFILPASDIPRFQQALIQAKEFLDAP